MVDAQCRYALDGLDAVRMIAESVPDPELVVVTVGDLGIVRDIRTGYAGVEIDVTPTYSCLLYTSPSPRD